VKKLMKKLIQAVSDFQITRRMSHKREVKAFSGNSLRGKGFCVKTEARAFQRNSLIDFHEEVICGRTHFLPIDTCTRSSHVKQWRKLIKQMRERTKPLISYSNVAITLVGVWPNKVCLNFPSFMIHLLKKLYLFNSRIQI